MTIQNTAVTRRGLKRVLKAVQSDIESARAEYKQQGMTKKDLDAYEQAVAWIQQESEEPVKKGGGTDVKNPSARKPPPPRAKTAQAA